MTSEQDPRPRPQYGEYADPSAAAEDQATPEQAAVEQTDTAQLNSEMQDSAQSVARGANDPAPSSAPAEQSVAQVQPHAQPVAAFPSGPGALPGVPHNLGVKAGSDNQAQHVAPAAQPYRAADPASSTANAPAIQQSAPDASSAIAASAAPPAPTPRPRKADRIITIALLAVGGYFALSMALSLSQLSLEFARIADDLGLKDFVAAPQVKTIGTVGAILVLAIYALVLIFSIRRLRARKLTFWAPLAAGVLAWVLFFVLFSVSLNQSPDLWQELMRVASNPAEAQKLLEQLNSRS